MAFGIKLITKEVLELILDHHSLALSGFRSEEGRKLG